MPQLNPSKSLTITNPLVIYRTLLANKRIHPDPAQHRLALHLQKLYYRLKDYQPDVDFSHRITQLNRLASASSSATNDPVHRNQTASKAPDGVFSFNLHRGQKVKNEATALTRRLTDHESAIQLQSPQGLLLYGDVGTGKSLLVGLLADSLPNWRKRRWHFNTFMLECFARLEQSRRNSLTPSASLTDNSQAEEHSLLALARHLISTSPILFLDEFQLPDRAAAKILSNLLTSFFHLGGVLIATSNRMPEELANASGVKFTAPPSIKQGLWRNGWGLLRGSDQTETNAGMFSGKSDFAAFLEVLRARCEVWDMEGGRDWRRREAEGDSSNSIGTSDEHKSIVDEGHGGLEPMSAGNLGLGYEQSLHVESQSITVAGKKTSKALNPRHYFIRPSSTASIQEVTEAENKWRATESAAVHGIDNTQPSDLRIPWEILDLRVYGRNLRVPRSVSGVSKWTFGELCCANFGPADYITIASTFHTLILTDVPILTFLQKNEARRFITLLDALYEARCKLLISAEAGPDNTFFPETGIERASNSDVPEMGSRDEVYPETFSEIYQDQTSPFRPNISSYTSSVSPPSYTSTQVPSLSSHIASKRSIQADEDSDFGPVYGAGRNRGRSDGVLGAGNEIGWRAGLDFARTGVFTGEDERFAYKRARSRLCEMCGARWWARKEEGWWRPLSKEARRWEGEPTESNTSSDDDLALAKAEPGGEGEGEGEGLFRHGASPFRVSGEAPPKFGFQHAWGMMTWGKKAGAWGKGPDGLDERKKRDG